MAGIPASGWSALAAMNGNVMYLNAGNSLYTVDVSTRTITSTKAVVGGWPSPGPFDIAFNPLDGFLYGYTPVNATTGRVVKIDPATEAQDLHRLHPAGCGQRRLGRPVDRRQWSALRPLQH